jgi:hypothetical protein
MEEREVVKELTRLQNLPTTKDDWQDLHETIEAYQRRCLARAIARSERRVELVATIRRLAGVEEQHA